MNASTVFYLRSDGRRQCYSMQRPQLRFSCALVLGARLGHLPPGLPAIVTRRFHVDAVEDVL